MDIRYLLNPESEIFEEIIIDKQQFENSVVPYKKRKLDISQQSFNTFFCETRGCWISKNPFNAVSRNFPVPDLLLKSSNNLFDPDMIIYIAAPEKKWKAYIIKHYLTKKIRDKLNYSKTLLDSLNAWCHKGRGKNKKIIFKKPEASFYLLKELTGCACGHSITLIEANALPEKFHKAV